MQKRGVRTGGDPGSGVCLPRLQAVTFQVFGNTRPVDVLYHASSQDRQY